MDSSCRFQKGKMNQSDPFGRQESKADHETLQILVLGDSSSCGYLFSKEGKGSPCRALQMGHISIWKRRAGVAQAKFHPSIRMATSTRHKEFSTYTQAPKRNGVILSSFRDAYLDDDQAAKRFVMGQQVLHSISTRPLD